MPQRRSSWFGLGMASSVVLSLVIISASVGLDRRIDDGGSTAVGTSTESRAAGDSPDGAPGAGAADGNATTSGTAGGGAGVGTGGAGTGGAGATSGGDAASTRPGTPATRGVTDDAIHVAVLEADLAGLQATGFGIDLGDLRGAWEAYIAEINAAGGVHGRQIVPHYIRFDPLDQEDMRRACIVATEDLETFAVLDMGVFYGPAVLCITEEHGEPLLSYEKEPRQWYERSRGLYFSLSKSKTRDLRTFPREVVALGHLPRDAKLGIVTSELPSDILPVEDELLPALDALGIDYELYVMSTDTTSWQAQIPLSVNAMQQAGVTHMYMGVNLIVSQLWVEAAESRLYEPQYMVSDFVGMALDVSTEQMPRSFDGAIGITTTRVGYERLGRPQPAVEKRCIDRYTAITGNEVEWTWPPDVDYTAALVCSVMDTFRDGLERAGRDLTREGWASAAQAIGSFELTGQLSALFSPGKFDAADAVVTIKWHYDYEGQECKCWLPIDDPRPPME